MFCTKCGAKLEPYQRFCCFCGTAVKSPQNNTQEIPSVQQTVTEPIPQPIPEAPIQDAPAQDAPAQDAPAQDAPAQDALAQDALAQDALAQDAPAVSETPVGSGTTQNGVSDYLNTPENLQRLGLAPRQTANGTKKISGMAITSFVLGIVTLVFGCCFNNLLMQILLLMASGFGLIAGILGINNKKQLNMAISGTVLNFMAVIEYSVIILMQFFAGLS